ncbi:chemotaxis response regulator protein-glutamate methylesterase [Oceanotoga sp. DSM 15011]|jgi:two-component system chemotaxis response regulator CheB|uniref:Protein-glutamate methylesterase/protein-glutamine glutaminase n=1 Tax=Oceanotoga teriensis TaxID=515440 RepID=A0AA45C9C8_9BACT|nr:MULTISPECIES: chemotaxis response regulator protein-glutamate methylesterase [Oceanotoga]MDN5343598.1 two-component system, chemotaxis family, protein-glutamate methylesterase/glutaminase [Oceanotoga sp.]MDO7977122.1 chemotaxis response regulator protein-glutamate methylesterase [Oceanotoga teriensis]PWJ96607.1 two-component system chemotaxis response regulator CheB [Oceanotoga teriensis]UYP00221.1 chemotaxis response regulator protein-glutamate methylesterase [Oceanotoga sp. DSM 15011]
MDKIKVLIVDDSAFMRMVLKDIIDKQPNMKVIGMARDGLEAVEKAVNLKPDIITLDVEMPKLNGLEALKIIMKKYPTRVIMVSSLTSEGASITIECLENGAVDFIQKPAGSTSWTFRQVQDDLLKKINDVFKISVDNLKIQSRPTKKITTTKNLSKDKILLIASSTGGPRSLDKVIPVLPGNLNIPVVVVQHMPAGFTKSLADRLNRISELTVKEAEEGDILEKNHVYIAPGNFHLGLKKEFNSVKLFLDSSDKINNVRPAADFTFDLAAEIFKSNSICVVLTGMGRDGAKGAFKINHLGGKVIAEAKETCVVYGMPKAVVEDGYADYVLANDKIAQKVVDILEGN